jgi:hypothetical protein
MAWKILQPEPNQPTQENQVRRDLPLADAIAAKTNSRLNTIIQKTSEAPKAANDNMEAPKAANDNAGVWSTSGKVEVASTQSRLDELRKALGKYTEETKATEAEVFEDLTSEQEVRVPTKEEQMPEPVLETGQTEVKAPFPQYTSLSGIDINNLPAHVPEAAGVANLLQIRDLETKMRGEVAGLKKFNGDAGNVINYINRQGFTGLSGEFFARIISAAEAKRYESKSKAIEIINEATKKIEKLKEASSEVDPGAIRAFEILSAKPSVEMPIGYKTGGGAKFLKAVNDNTSANAFIIALQAANKKAA